MGPRRNAIGTTIIAVVAVAVIMVGTVGFVMFTSQPSSSSSSSSTSPNQSTSSGPSSTPSGASETNSTTSASGLRLTEAINASTIRVGESLNISVSIGNTHDSLNSIHPSDQWAFQGVPVALWPDCFFGLPVQMVVLNGSYSLQDLPTVANVTFNYICMEDVNVDHVNFQPNSNQVNLTGIYDVTGANQSLGPFRMTLNFTTAGYWNLLGLSKELNTPIVGEDQPTPPSYTAFAPGVYTIAIADEWGQAVVLHVNVLPALTSGSSTSSSHTHPSASTSTSTSLNTSLCISPGQPLGLFLRVLNDSTSLPVVGANVTAVADGYSSNCGIATVSAFTWQATDAFMTNNTEWYSLNAVNVGSYQFTVTYSGHTYNFVAQLGLSTYTCATLYLPSGATNTTISDETSCASGSV